jgi:nicotinamide mononucleotide transporter
LLLSLQQIFEQLVSDLKATTALEYIAVLFGIASVWYSRKEHILVYPIGLVNTIAYIYISLKASLFGEASVNLYYTIMSIYGWVLWSKKNIRKENLIKITYSTAREWGIELLFFAVCYIFIFISLSYLKKEFAPGAIPWADAFASATAFTAMWLMAKKKVESWYWWIATNIASIPLYFVKHYVFTSFYYFVLLLMAFWGLSSWIKKAKYYTSVREKIPEWKQ